jgi:hypothetical protein
MRLRFLRFFVKYLLWFGALLLGWNEGRVLPSYGIFKTSWVKSAPYACQPKNKASKTPHAEFFTFGKNSVKKTQCGRKTKLRTDRKLPVYRTSLQTVKPAARLMGAPRARDAWIKFMEIYGNPRAGAARALCVYFYAAKNTVLEYRS